MDSIKNYLLSVIGAALISGIACSVIGKKGAVGSLVKLLTGLFLVITVIAPWTKIRIDDLSSFYSGFSVEASNIAAEGEALANQELAAIIKSQVEAYILDKASALNLDLEIEVKMSATQPPIPESITLKGAASPFGKQYLENILCNDIGIAKENQLWI